MLVARDVDLILGMECSAAPRRDDTRFHREELLGDVLDAVLPTDHPLAGPRADRPRRARATRRGSRRPSAGRATRSSSPAAAPPGFCPRVAHRAGDWQAVMGLVAGGLGISLVPRLAHTAPPAGRRDHPADRRPAQAPRVRRLPRRRRVLARDPRACSTRSPTAPAARLRWYARHERRSSSTSTGSSWTPSRPGTRPAATSSPPTAARGRTRATRDMLGMSSKEWPVYVVEELGAQLTPERGQRAPSSRRCSRATASSCRCCRARARRSSGSAQTHTLGLASSSNRPVIDLVLETHGRHRPLRRHRLLRGGRARQARARRLPGGDAAPRHHRGRRDRGLRERHPAPPTPPACA